MKAWFCIKKGTAKATVETVWQKKKRQIVGGQESTIPGYWEQHLAADY